MQSRTKVMHKTLKPQWNEELHVLVQEPTTQLLRVEMFDHDLFNPKASPKNLWTPLAIVAASAWS